jgi:hypothetical protein
LVRGGATAANQTGKSFLLLFFKKEVLPFSFPYLRAYGAQR